MSCHDQSYATTAFTLFVLLVAPLVQTRVTGQELLYSQRTTSSSTVGLINDVVEYQDTNLLIHVKHNHLFVVNLVDGVARRFEQLDASFWPYGYFGFAGDHRLFFTRTEGMNRMYLIGPDGSVQGDQLDDSVQTANHSYDHTPDGVVRLGRGSKEYTSVDYGVTWNIHDRQGSVPLGVSSQGSGAALCVIESGRQFYECLLPDRGDAWVQSPMTRTDPYGGELMRIVHLGSDSLAWLTTRVIEGDSSQLRLYVGALGDTVAQRVDSALLNGTIVRLDPLQIFETSDRCVFYLDKMGWTATYCDGSWTLHEWRPREAFLDGRGDHNRYSSQKRGWAYLRIKEESPMVMYRIDLRHPVSVDSIILPVGVKDHLVPAPAQLQGLGYLNSGLENQQELIYWPDRSVYAFGSFIREIDIFPLKRMLFTWEDGEQLCVVTDLEQLVRPDAYGRGRVVRGLLLSDETRQPNVGYHGQHPDGDLRERGASVPAVLAQGRIFSGPVVRVTSSDGTRADTLLNAPTSFGAVLRDGRFATGWKGVLRLHRQHTIDTFDISSVNSSADSMGYPSHVVQCTAGTLVASVLGTHRIDPATNVTRAFRWGGILRSTDDGATWVSTPLPTDDATYVMSLAETRDGTLLATTMRMVEDTVVGERTQSSYQANRVCILRSSDCGQTWNAVHQPVFSGSWQITSGNIVQHPDGTLYAALISGIYYSTNDGQSWVLDERLPLTTNPASIALSSSGAILVAASDGVYRLDHVTSVNDATALPAQQPMRILSVDQLSRYLEQRQINDFSLSDAHGRTISMQRRNFPGMMAHSSIPGLYVLFAEGQREIILLVDD